VLALLIVAASFASMFSYCSHSHCTYENSARSQIGMLQMAVKRYALEVGMLPTNSQGFESLLAAPHDLTAVESEQWRGPYLDKLQLPVDPWNNPYRYCRTSAKEFRIWSRGADGLSGTRDDITLPSS